MSLNEFWDLTPIEFNIVVEGFGRRQITEAWLSEAMARQKFLKQLDHYLEKQVKILTDEERLKKKKEHNDLVDGLKAAERKRGN